MSTSPAPVFTRFIDDAAIFPPGNAPMGQAVSAHEQHRRSWYGALVGPFVCSDQRLPELGQVLAVQSGDAKPLAVSVTVSGGAGAIDPALRWVERDARLALAGVEVTVRAEPPMARNVHRVATVLADCLPPDVPAYVELPRQEGWSSALDAVAESGHRAKLRTGGPEPADVPDETEVADFLLSCLDREVAFKCTAGLHHAVRHLDAATGLEQHGFLNLLLATRTALDGGATGEVAAVLAEREPTTLAAGIRDLDERRASSTRGWFCSYGSCSVLEPVSDLVALGLVSEPAGPATVIDS